MYATLSIASGAPLGSRKAYLQLASLYYHFHPGRRNTRPFIYGLLKDIRARVGVWLHATPDYSHIVRNNHMTNYLEVICSMQIFMVLGY